MELVTTLLNDAVERKAITLPSKCRPVKLSHLLFADDFMIFLKADRSSITEVLRILGEFHHCSGLKANNAKSSIILGGIFGAARSELVTLSTFKETHLPIRYLGIPLISGRLKAIDCAPIFDMVQRKLEGWKTCFLSYAGRLQLINSVLQGAYIYWSGVFRLPATFIAKLESMFAQFFWSGPTLVRKVHFVSWATICTPRREGGLGVKRVKDINITGMLKRLWEVASKKETVWVEWVTQRYLKNDSIWTVAPTTKGSWAWRKLLTYRYLMESNIRHYIGNGADTYLWLDPWHPHGILLQKYGERVRYDSGLPRLTKVNAIVQAGCWSPGIDYTWELRDIWRDLPSISHRSGSDRDRVVWGSSPNGVFTSKLGWKLVRHPLPVVEWAQSLWFSGHIPKHSLTLWRCLHDGLPTADQLTLRSIRVNPACSFCWAGLESRNHLFFECPFTAGIWKQMVGLCYPHHRILSHVTSEAIWVSTQHQGVGNLDRIGKLALGATVHHIWQERNFRIFRNKARTRETILQSIQTDVRDRCKSLTFTGNPTPSNLVLASTWHVEFSST